MHSELLVAKQFVQSPGYMALSRRLSLTPRSSALVIILIVAVLFLKYQIQDMTLPPTNIYVSPTRQKVLSTESGEFRARASKYGWKLYTGKRANNHIVDNTGFAQRDSTDIDISIREGIENKNFLSNVIQENMASSLRNIRSLSTF